MRLSRDARNYLLFGTMLFVVLEALLAFSRHNRRNKPIRNLH